MSSLFVLIPIVAAFVVVPLLFIKLMVKLTETEQQKKKRAIMSEANNRGDENSAVTAQLNAAVPLNDLTNPKENSFSPVDTLAHKKPDKTKGLRFFSILKRFTFKTLFAACLLLFLSLFFGVMPLPWLYLPLVAFLYFRPLFKVAAWVYVGLMIVTLLQMVVVSAVYPKQYPPGTDLYFYGGLPVAPFFIYELQFSPEQECRATDESQYCGYQLSQWAALSPAANCNLLPSPQIKRPLNIRVKAGLCQFTRLPTTPATVGPEIIVDIEPEIFTLHAMYIYSELVLFICLLLLNNIRQSYRTPAKKLE
jgi:hypothetical protein